jgi:tRNA(Ile)-lysidine synthase
MNISLEYDKSKTYLVACSFGPDSMFLLNLLLNNGFKVVVCHVNYHTREASNSEEERLRDYCSERNVPIEVLDTTGMPAEGNFEAWAREVRYDFFKKMYKKHKAYGLFVGHHLDDHIETYLFQQERKSRVRFFGLSQLSEVKGMKVYRPLLSITKDEILEENKKNNTPYSIDITNLSDDYSRNYIRHHIVEPMSKEEKIKIADSISHLNWYRGESYYKTKETQHLTTRYILVSHCKKLDFEHFSECIYRVMEDWKVFTPISEGEMRELYKNLNSKKPNIEVNLGDGIYYFQEYGRIYIMEKYQKYEYVMERPCALTTDEFDLDFSGDTSDRNIFLDDYPLTIRTIKQGDRYQISNYEVSVRRLFIDWKIPKHLRSVWPIIVNKDDKIIYIPRYRNVYKDKHKTRFKISLK